MSENYTGWTVTRDEGDGTLLLQSPAGHVVRLSIEMRSVISLEKEIECLRAALREILGWNGGPTGAFWYEKIAREALSDE